jgi:iron complex outermembrane receptor protein
MSKNIVFKKTLVAHALTMAFGVAALPGLAMAQEAQRVEITGSSIKRLTQKQRCQIVTITKAEIDRTGATSTQELEFTFALSTSGATANATGAGTSTGGLSSTLRGLGSARTLVLNGRRLASFAGSDGASVNVNVIPLAAIERIEVLKDGASGVYGSDAVAGVVNFILLRKANRH